jgi:hypothetical protein
LAQICTHFAKGFAFLQTFVKDVSLLDAQQTDPVNWAAHIGGMLHKVVNLDAQAGNPKTDTQWKAYETKLKVEINKTRAAKDIVKQITDEEWMDIPLDQEELPSTINNIVVCTE